MKAAELTNIGEICLSDRPVPKIKNPRDVRIRIQAVGICGSDVHYYSSGRIGDQIVEYPWVVGHETAGIVDETGPEVSILKKGDRIAVDPSVPCGTCDQCAAGRYHTCRDQVFLGCPGQIEGCLAEYIVMPEFSCYPLPDTLSFEDAVLTEPLSIGMYAVRLSGIHSGQTAAIFGAGPIGLSVLLAALTKGIHVRYCVDPLRYRAAAAGDRGASWTGGPGAMDKLITGELQDVDIAFECCGEQEALDQALEVCKPGGALMIVGIPEFERYSFDAHTARRKELAFRNVRRQNNCVRPAIDAVADGSIRPGFMATHHFSLDEVQYAFDLVRDYKDGVIKTIIHM